MITYRELRYSNAGAFEPPNDPASWTEYNFAQEPTENGFTQLPFSGSPTLDVVTSGNPSQRRIDITPNGGSVIWMTTQSPNLDPAVGVTGEIGLEVSASNEYAGFEFQYLDGVVNFVASSGLVELHIPTGDAGESAQTVEVSEIGETPLDNTAQTLFRVTVDSSRNVRMYRNGSLIIGPLVMPVITKPAQKFQFWGEGG